MNDRIKLAEAMGWTGVLRDYGIPHDGPPFKKLPDPFTDANDDYAVLEWVRAIEAEGLDRRMMHMDFAMHLPEAYDYLIGDYARAALRVLE